MNLAQSILTTEIFKTNYIYAWLSRSDSQVKMTKTKPNRLRFDIVLFN